MTIFRIVPKKNRLVIRRTRFPPLTPQSMRVRLAHPSASSSGVESHWHIQGKQLVRGKNEERNDLDRRKLQGSQSRLQGTNDWRDESSEHGLQKL
jgi:hypothetical protein